MRMQVVRSTVLTIIAVLPGFGAGAVWATEHTIQLDATKSTVDFTLADVLHTVHGTFKLKSGAVRFDPVNGTASGAFVIDAKSGASGSDARDKRMHKNILESTKYDEIVFAPDHFTGTIAPQGTSEIQVHGMFKIHGAQHEVTMPVQLQIDPGQVTATTHFPVPYVQWGMKNPSNFLLHVNDTVDIDIKAVGHMD